MALSGSGKRRISPQLHARTCGQARRPLRYPGGGYSGRPHPVSAPGAEEPSSADTGRQKAGTVSSLPTMQRSAVPRFAHGRTVRNPSATSVLICWSRTLGTILLLCCICEGRRFFPGHKISPSVGHRITPVDGTDGLFMYQIAKHGRESSCTNDFFVIFV